MRYVIDGYNLLHHVGRLQAGRNANLNEARLDLLRLLQLRYSGTPDQVTVVFDARGASGPVKAMEDYHGIEVRYTRSEEADDVIEAVIRGESAPQRLTVVSNDRRLKEAARRKGCPVAECVEFWESLEKKAAPTPSPAPPKDDTGLSPEEVAKWQKAFGDLDRDPRYKDVLGGDNFKDFS